MRTIFLVLALFCFTEFARAEKALQLYGGEDHNEYLGCFNCSPYDSSSIWNDYGTYGSSYNSKSIWNSYGTYGSSYSSYSPFNQYASYPPVIVDGDGNFYGYLTVNKYHDKRADFKLALIVCEYWELIQKDVSGWAKKLFD